MEFDFEDPNPDIHDLFCHYNALYFQDSLGACFVSWSSKRMTLCAGVCHYLPGGGCEIRLSEPLLKFRPTSDIKDTLLHEMIHAYLWIKSDNDCHSEHGPSFRELMNEINSSSVIDHHKWDDESEIITDGPKFVSFLQRPYGGYHITVYHSFNDEVDNYRVHHWQCQSCGDLIKRAMNREPSANDCVVRSICDGFCGNPSCHWHMHKMSCNGNYKKIAEPTDYKDKRKASKRRAESEGHKPEAASQPSKRSGRKSSKEEGGKDLKSNTIDTYYPIVREAKHKVQEFS
ncbi:hypothetical protein ACLOJK_023735 [Asimina triloba]